MAVPAAAVPFALPNDQRLVMEASSSGDPQRSARAIQMRRQGVWSCFLEIIAGQRARETAGNHHYFDEGVLDFVREEQAGMPVSRFGGFRDLQEFRLSQMRAEDLEADGKVFSVAGIDGAAGDGDAGDAGEVGGDGEDVGEIFLERIGTGGTDFAGGAGDDGGEDGVDFLEGVLEVAADEGADFLGAAVVGVVVAGGEHVGAEDDAAFHFGAEAFLAGFFVEIEDVGGVGGAVAVADAVEAGEVGGGFGRGDDVVGGDGVFGVGQGNFHQLGTLGGEGLDGFFDLGADAGVDAVAEIFLRDAEFEAFHAVVERGEVVGHRDVEAGGVRGIEAGDGLQDERGVFDRLRERADLVERRGEGDEAVAGNAAVGGFQADDAAMRGGLADGAAGVGAERGDGGVVGDGGGGTTGRTAGDAGVVVGVAGFSERGVFGGGAHGELVLIEAAEGDRPGGAEFFDDGGVVGRDVVFEEFRAAGAGLAEHVHVVLDGDRDAAEGQREVGVRGFGEGGFEIVGKVGTGGSIAGGDFSGEFFQDGGGCGFSGGELLAELGNGHFG